MTRGGGKENVTLDPAMQERATGLRRTLVMALVTNLCVAGAKLLYGALSGSVAMGVDGLHSLLDAGASAAGLVGVAGHPPARSRTSIWV
jgi:divalent metal cation (Fe/Co/Zn/Cd) transporter